MQQRVLPVNYALRVNTQMNLRWGPARYARLDFINVNGVSKIVCSVMEVKLPQKTGPAAKIARLVLFPEENCTCALSVHQDFILRRFDQPNVPPVHQGKHPQKIRGTVKRYPLWSKSKGSPWGRQKQVRLCWMFVGNDQKAG